MPPPRFSTAVDESLHHAGLLVLRVLIGGLMLGNHGWGKLMSFSEKAGSFPDPLGVGSTLSLSLTIVGELVAPALLMVGLFTRAAAAPLLVTMLVAAFVVHGDDPWRKKEMALLYAVPALTLLLAGGGRWSADGWLRRRAL
jgi:putative oxidoreductase